MARLPKSFRKANRTTESFRKQFADLPTQIQRATKSACLLFHGNPSHSSLRHHLLEDRRAAHHVPQSWSVSITMQYRAIYVKDESGINVWYWIGTHAQYDAFTGG